MSTNYFSVLYPSQPTNMYINAIVSTTNPWTNKSSTTAILPTNTDTDPVPTSGTWAYFVVDYYESYSPTYTETTTTVPSQSNYTIFASNSVLYVYILGNGGVYSSPSCGGGGTGGFGAACYNPTTTYSVSCGFGSSTNPTFMGGVPYSETSGQLIDVFVGSGSNTSTSDGGNGAIIGNTSTTVIDSSYITYNNNTYQAVNSSDTIINAAVCIGGVGGQPYTGSTTVGTSYNTLPTGSPNWISITDTNGIFNIIMADGTSYPMPSSPYGTSGANSSILFAVFTPSS
jgi:hypothetical protein